MARDQGIGGHRAYRTPVLKVYGSVRDLTGNNSGGGGDMNFPAPAPAMGT